ncbi:MAG: DksA/TraR family C4-type zinc finger protein [Wenzhouxiangella sp.]|jgi:phage/conjugal plasmid C-4 type zinc finger TraR family protein|nr:DksA/TraR family C4-type zinc finger protein [Wenzhouxiangella sp.]
MAGGWAKDGAVQEQIDSTVDDAVERARARLPKGPSLTHCDECGEPIPDARRAAIPGVRLCVTCQTAHDKQDRQGDIYNRRGSKDSQLR